MPLGHPVGFAHTDGQNISPVNQRFNLHQIRRLLSEHLDQLRAEAVRNMKHPVRPADFSAVTAATVFA